MSGRLPATNLGAGGSGGGFIIGGRSGAGSVTGGGSGNGSGTGIARWNGRKKVPGFENGFPYGEDELVGRALCTVVSRKATPEYIQRKLTKKPSNRYEEILQQLLQGMQKMVRFREGSMARNGSRNLQKIPCARGISDGHCSKTSVGRCLCCQCSFSTSNMNL